MVAGSFPLLHLNNKKRSDGRRWGRGGEGGGGEGRVVVAAALRTCVIVMTVTVQTGDWVSMAEW